MSDAAAITNPAAVVGGEEFGADEEIFRLSAPLRDIIQGTPKPRSLEHTLFLTRFSAGRIAGNDFVRC